MPILAFFIVFLALIFAPFEASAQDASSPNLGLLLMGSGLHPNDWGTQTNTNMTKLDTAIGGTTSLSVAGGALTLTVSQTNVAFIAVTGTLGSNETITFPTLPSGKVYQVGNWTSGAYTLTIASTGGGTTYVPQGYAIPVYVDNSIAKVASASTDPNVPVSTIWNYAGATAPNSSWNLGDGSAISRTTYAALYAVIGTTYGIGDGVTTFNIPDCRGNVMAGPDGGTGRLNSWTVGTMGGSSTHVLTTAEMPAHNHGVTDPGHTHGVTDPGHAHGPGAGADFVNYSATVTASTIQDGGGSSFYWTPTTTTATAVTGITVNSATTGITTQNTGSGGAHSIVQPTLVTNCIIRVN